MNSPKSGKSELNSAFAACAPGLVATGSFSIIINILMLTGPIYMMLVYDRALPSQSVPTLIGLSVLVLGMYAVFGILSVVRSHLLVRMGNRIGNKLQERVFDAQLRQAIRKGGSNGEDASRDLNLMREFMGGPTPSVLFDIPWTPVYLGVAYILHPYLGYIGLAGVFFLIGIAIINDILTRHNLGKSNTVQRQSNRVMNDAMRNFEVIAAMKMGSGLFKRWSNLQNDAQARQSETSDLAATLSTISRTVRLLLQSAVLGFGAYLAIGGDLSAGSIIAASVIVGRALAPAEQAISGWRQCIAANAARKRLIDVLDENPPLNSSIHLPEPKGEIHFQNVFAIAPNSKTPILKNVSFKISAGEVLAIIGPSGSGKSTLARLMVGAWEPVRGHVRMDRAEMSYWNAVQLRNTVGYLPQTVELFDGSVRDNIARFQDDATDDAIIAASVKADAHDLIVNLPDAYDTQLGESGGALSGGERQRIGLARVLYGDPALVVLDEPNANLDGAGVKALNSTIAKLKDAGKTVVVIAHRPSALALADKVLVLEKGQISAFGPSDEILRKASEGTEVAAKKVVQMNTRKTTNA